MTAIRPVPTLTTPRFTLRPLERGDAAALFPTLSDPAQCRYLTRPAFGSPEELWDWLAEPGWPGRSWIAQGSRGVAGRFVAVPFAEDARISEIGYITCTGCQREGVARECMTALIAQHWREGARLLTAEIDTRNAPSIRLAEALGFAHVKTVRAAEITHAGPCDLAFYELRSPHARNA